MTVWAQPFYGTEKDRQVDLGWVNHSNRGRVEEDLRGPLKGVRPRKSIGRVFCHLRHTRTTTLGVRDIIVDREIPRETL